LPALAGYLRREKPAALISALELANLIALVANKITGSRVRVVVQMTTTMSRIKRSAFKKRLFRLLVSRIYPWASGIVSSSRGVADDFTQYTGIPADRVTTIYNPVITDTLLEQAKETVGHPFFQAGQPPVIVALGRLTAAKDYPTLLRAYALVRKEHPSRLVIMGEGEERSSLEGLAAELGLGKEVDLPGFVENPFAILGKSVVYVLSSAWEGLPSTLIEALACGCQVVSTDCPHGPAEILAGGEYGCLVPVGDAVAMSAAILNVLDGYRCKPVPPDWLDQFKIDTICHRYLDVLAVKDLAPWELP
jgi:glycosyltransferase involved in cell wall biosynthesis